MPRKAAVDPSTAPAEPRRSTRISSQVKPAQTPAPPKKPRQPSKKRTADEAKQDDGNAAAEDTSATGVTESEEKASKKAKNVEETAAADVDEEKDELASDISEKPKPLDIGDNLPPITLKNEKDENVNVQDLVKDNGLVLFLVPKADTPGCTNQACGFRDSYPDFEAVNYKVYCLSADTPAAQTKWQAKYTLPYPLLSDRQRVLIGALGAGVGNKTQRSHFIFEKGGKLVEKKLPVKPADSPKLAIEFVKGHTA